MTRRRFAEGTTVPISRTRDEIAKLLREWGCVQLQWSDDFAGGRAQLSFVWPYEGQAYVARFPLQMPTEKELRNAAHGDRGYSHVRFQKLVERNGRAEHRVLLLLLKAALNAVEGGVIDVADLFLPWIAVSADETVAQRVRPMLAQIAAGSVDARRLLGSGQ